MSDLFSLSNILNEVSETLVQSNTSPTMLPMCIKRLQDIDTSIFEATTNLHMAILEADSKKKENDRFAEFFKQYKDTIQNYIMQAKSLVSTFTINLETFADANKDLECSLDDIQYTTYNGIEFSNLLDDSSSICPYDAFKKEFAFIGKLMQDLGPMASENQKTQIIATVCNNLSKEIQSGWLDKCAKKLSGSESKDGFARSMYNKFVKSNNTEIEVDIGLVKQCQLDIVNYSNFINSITKTVDNFCSGLEKVADEVGSLFFRNKDHKFPIKTNVDGIEDKVYRLNDYSFNQMNIFISTKTSQITELCNLFLIAISIKMDCIYKYLKQCKDIINIANGTPCGDDCSSNGDNDDIGEEQEPEFDDFDGDSEDVVQDDTDIEMECYLFEASIYEQTRVIKSLVYRESAYESLLEDSVAGSTNTNNANGAKDTGFIKSKLNSIKAVIDNILKRIRILIEKFKSSITGNYSKRIAMIRTNLQAINDATIPTDWTIQKMNVTKLLGLKVPPLLPNDYDSLQDTEQYIKSKYPGIIADAKEQGQSIKDRMMSICMPSDKEVPYSNVDRQEGITFVTKVYEDKALKSVENNQKTIEQSRQKMDTLLNESVASNHDDMFSMNEDSATGNGNSNTNSNGQPSANGNNRATTSNTRTNTSGQNSAQNAINAEEEKAKQLESEEKANKKQTAISNYFTVNTEIVTASMSIYVAMVNKHLKFLEKLAKISGYKAN